MRLSNVTDRLVLKIYNGIKRRIDIQLKSKILRNPEYLLEIGEGFQFDFNKSIFKVEPLGRVNFGDSVHFREFCNVYVFKNATLKLGDHVFFNRYCSVNCLGNIDIGEYTIFGEGVKLYDHNHTFEYASNLIKNAPTKIGKIFIGRNCWIGSNVTILNNVKIGDNVVIGAGNLIYKDIPSNVVVKNKVDAIIQDRKY